MVNPDYCSLVTVCVCVCHVRHPDASSRPQPRDVLKGLLGNVDEVLAIPAEDVPAGSQAAILGAPLDRATHLYQDLQNMYKM